jgi:enoyl-CoA hydratase/carnithine racemase
MPFLTRHIMSSMRNEIVFDKINNVGFILLNREKQLNSLSRLMLTSLLKQLKEWDDDKSLSMILIKSSTDRAFCAGGDVKAMLKLITDGRIDVALDTIKTQFTLNHQISKSKKPYIALINGITMGGGTEQTLFD